MSSYKKIYTILIIISAFLFIVILGIIFKTHEVYKRSVQMAETNENVIELLGEPIKTSLFCSGSLKNMKYAKYRIYFKGPKGKGSLLVIANKRHGEWIFDKAIFKSQDELLDLLAENSPSPQIDSKSIN